MRKRFKGFRYLTRRPSTHQLRQISHEDFSLNDADLLRERPEDRGSLYFLGFFPQKLIEQTFEKYEIFQKLKNKGFDDFQLIVDTKDPFRHRLAVYFQEKDKNHLLGEAVLKRKHLTLYPAFPCRIYGRSFEFLAVEWLCLQNPKGRFSPERPRMPGQTYPGLGMGNVVLELMLYACTRMRLAGILNVPEYFHNAQLYGKEFLFIDPEAEGKRQAMARDLLNIHPLAAVSWAVDLHCVFENEEPFVWFISEQVIPLDEGLKEYFRSKDYQTRVKQALEKYHYRLDVSCWEEKKKIIKHYDN